VLVVGLLDARSGMADVEQAKSQLSASDVVSKAAATPLRSAGRQFAAAGGLLRSPLLAPFDVVPVLGRQLRSVQDLSSAAERVATIGVRVITEAHAVLHAPHSSGPERVAALRRLATLAGTTDRQLAGIDTGPAHALLPGLASKHDTFVRDLTDVRTRLQHAAGVASTLADILQGPRTYLLVMANNAEMRAGSGDFLEVGALTTTDGSFHLSNVQPTVSIPVAPGVVTATGDLQARWGWLRPGVDWRNLGFTPQFDVNGPMAARMWEAETGQHVDGVLTVDLEALHQFLEVTGPVVLPGGAVVGADNVVRLLAHDQYVGLSDQQTTQQNLLQAGREDRLGALAKATLDALQSEPLDLKSLANAMTAATQGRHILAWSARSSAQSVWVRGGVAGDLSADSMLVAVINRGGNKLDPYLSVRVGLGLTGHGARTDGTLTVDVANHTPPGQSQFIAGPYPGLGTVYGEYVGVLAVNVPGYASVPHIDGHPRLDALGAEGPTWVIATPVDIKAGSQGHYVVRFTLPLASGRITVLPSARLTPETWHYGARSTTDATRFTVSW